MNTTNNAPAAHQVVTRTTIETAISVSNDPPIHMGDITLDRSADSPLTYMLDAQLDEVYLLTRRSGLELDPRGGITFQEAWFNFHDDNELADATVFIGPGDGPITLRNLDILQGEIQVFDATLGRAVLVGKFFHRLHALKAIKSILATGGCPVAVSAAYSPESEWDVVSVLDCETLDNDGRASE